MHREKSFQAQKLDSDLKDMEAKLTRADKSVSERNVGRFSIEYSLEMIFRLLRINEQHELHDIKLNH